MRSFLRVDECNIGSNSSSFDARREACTLTNWYENDTDKSLDTRDLDWWFYIHESSLGHITNYLKEPCEYGKPFNNLYNNKIFHQLMWNKSVFYTNDDLEIFAACIKAAIDDFISYAQEELEMLLGAIVDLFRKDEEGYEVLCDALTK